jgi:hypothetical protein
MGSVGWIGLVRARGKPVFAMCRGGPEVRRMIDMHERSLLGLRLRRLTAHLLDYGVLRATVNATPAAAMPGLPPGHSPRWAVGSPMPLGRARGAPAPTRYGCHAAQHPHHTTSTLPAMGGGVPHAPRSSTGRPSTHAGRVPSAPPPAPHDQHAPRDRAVGSPMPLGRARGAPPPTRDGRQAPQHPRGTGASAAAADVRGGVEVRPPTPGRGTRPVPRRTAGRRRSP